MIQDLFSVFVNTKTIPVTAAVGQFLPMASTGLRGPL